MVSSSLESENGDFDGEPRVLDIGISDQNKTHSGGGDSVSGGDGGDGDDEDEREFGPMLKFGEVMKEADARGVKLPSDITEAAKSNGIRKLFFLHYLDLQGSVWPLGLLMKYCFMLRNGMLADPSFLFKAGGEIVIDSCCATFVEMKERGKDFWSEFEFCLADLLVGAMVDIALVDTLVPLLVLVDHLHPEGYFGACNMLVLLFLAGVFLAVSSNTRCQIINGLERLVEASPVAKQVPPVAMAFRIDVRLANNTYGGMQFVDWPSGVECTRSNVHSLP